MSNTSKYATPSHLWTVVCDLDDQLLKLNAWNAALLFLLEGMDMDHEADKKPGVQAGVLAARYPMYNKMLNLAVSGLHDCENTMTALLDQLKEEVPAWAN